MKAAKPSAIRTGRTNLNTIIMAQTYSLSIYSVTINKRGKRDELQLLSDFNNGKDFLDYITSMLNVWKLNNKTHEEENPVALDEEESKAFRIGKDASGHYIMHCVGRSVSGIIESGEYGTEEEGIDIETGKSSFKKKKNEALLKPFYFQFYVPRNSVRAFMLIERIGANGIMSIMRNAMLKYFSAADCDEYVLNVNPLTLNKLVDKKMQQMSGEAKKVILRRVRKDDLRVSKILGLEAEAEGISTDVVYNAAINKVFSFAGFLENIKNKYNTETKLYEVDQDLSCGDIAFNVKIAGQDKVFSLQNIQSLGMSMDISNKVAYGANSYPTFKTLNDVADEMLSLIRDQFEIVNHE